MNHTDPPSRRSPVAWAAFIVCTGSLCFSLVVALRQPRPGGFIARYGLVSLGIAMTSGTTANLLSLGSFHRKWLMVVTWTALVISWVGLYQVSR